MTKSKLGIDFNKVQRARDVAAKIAADVQGFADDYTTVAVERTLCRLVGVDNVDDAGAPLPNVLVDDLKNKNVLEHGALFFLGNTILETGQSPHQIAERVASENLDITTFAFHSQEEIAQALKPFVDASIRQITERRKKREHYLATIGEGSRPYLYVIVARGNI